MGLLLFVAPCMYVCMYVCMYIIFLNGKSSFKKSFVFYA